MVDRRLLVLPAAGTLTTALLAALIGDQSGLNSHHFLLWNLFLGWIPLLAAWALYRCRRRPVTAFLCGLVWLAFLPNAPYLITDLIHVGELNAVLPLWLDVGILAVAAATGLLLGVLSLFYVHALVHQRYGHRSWLFVAAIVPLASFGVYLGRGPRFNSWDVVNRPDLLLELAFERLASPQDHPLMVTGVLLFSVGLGLSYLALYALATRFGRSSESRS